MNGESEGVNTHGLHGQKELPFSRSSKALLSPILRGGRALTGTIRGMTTDTSQQESSLVRTVQRQFSNVSPKQNISLSNQSQVDGAMSVSFRHVQVTAERRTVELEHNVQQVENELKDLRSLIERHEQSLASMNELVVNVQEDQVVQQRSVERVQRRFHGHRVTIDRALQQTQLALQQQSAVLTRQEVLLERFERRQVSMGGVVMESVYVLVGMYVIQTPLFKYTVQLVTVHLDSTGRHRKWLPRFLQIFFFMHFVNICKSFTRRFNFTSGFWSLVSRGTQSAWKRVTSIQANLFKSVHPQTTLESLIEPPKQCASPIIKSAPNSPGLAGLLDDMPGHILQNTQENH